MCADCWNAAMGLPAAAVAGRFAWVGYKDRIPFLRRSGRAPDALAAGATDDITVDPPADEPHDVPAGVG